MKIIFCFFGLNRSLSKTIKSIRQQLFLPCQRSGIPFEIHAAFMTPGETFTNPRSGEFDCRPERSAEQLLGNCALTLIDQDAFDRSFDFEPVLYANDPWDDNYVSVRNSCRALRSLEVVTASWAGTAADGAETVYCYVRPDLWYHDPLPIAQLRHGWALHRENLFLTPYWATHGGLNDRLACLGRNAALHYGNRIHQIAAFLQSSQQGLHAEGFVRFVAGQIPGARMQPALTLRASRVRSNGRVRVESFVNTSGKSLPWRWALASKSEAYSTLWEKNWARWKAGLLRRVRRGR